MNIENIIASILEQAGKVAAYHEHMATTPGLSPEIVASHQSIANVIRGWMRTIKENKDPESIRKLCRFLRLEELLKEYEKAIAPPARRDRGLEI